MTLVDVNDVVCQLFGLERGDFLSLESNDTLMKMLHDVFKHCTKDNEKIEFATINSTQGEAIPVTVSMYGCGGDRSELVHMVLRDRSGIEEDSVRNEALARQWMNTFNSISDFVSVHDKDFKFMQVNRSLSNFLDISPETLHGKYCYEIMHGTNEPWHNCPHRQLLHSGETVTEVIEDSNIGVPLLVQCSPYFNEEGEFLGSVHVARDISKQRADEEEKERLISELHQALEQVKKLSGFLPICSGCKKIRDDQGYWTQIESYISEHSEAEFSHSLCPSCIKIIYPDYSPEDWCNVNDDKVELTGHKKLRGPTQF